MKSGFLISSDPKVSLLREKRLESDPDLGKRKFRSDDFDFERNIGEGNFCKVWRVTLKSDPLAAFALKATVNSKNQQLSVRQERSALLTLNSPGHPNVIRLVDTFRDDSHVYLIYESADGGELWELVKNCGSISDALGRHLILQVLSGLEYIHSKGIVHRDLKCENVVVSGSTLKIIDFGSSSYANPDGRPPTAPQPCPSSGRRPTRHEHYVGTPNFMDPQSISNQDTGFARDLWGFGALIYQVLVGRPPFYGSTEYFVLKRVKENDLVFPPGLNPDARDLISSLLNPDPEKRLSLAEARNHPFLASGEAAQLSDFGDIAGCREPCYRIGRMLIELQNSRSPELSEEFRGKFEENLAALRAKRTESNKVDVDRLIDLMGWSLDQTRSEITSETIEAERWLL